MNQTIFSQPYPMYYGKLHNDFPFATIKDKSYGHYNKYVKQQTFIDDLITNNIITGSIKKSKKDKPSVSHNNPKIKEIFKSMKLTENEYNLAKKYFEKINKEKLTKRKILLFEDNENNVMFDDFLKPLDTNKVTEYWKDYNRFPLNMIKGTWHGEKNDLIKAKMNYLYVLKMIFSPGNDHLGNPKKFDTYSQYDQFAICYMLIIENDPVSVYLILYHLYLNNEKSVKLKYYNKISQVNYKTEYTTKIFFNIPRKRIIKKRLFLSINITIGFIRQ